MNDFKRDHGRYIVIKDKDLTPAQRVSLQCHLDVHATPTRECVVVEPDWTIYEMVWHLVEREATGQSLPYMTDEHPDKVNSLAAHVARQTELLAMLVDVPELMGGKWESMARDAINDAPTSLTHLKAGWQAEALEELAEKLRWGHVVDAIKEEAAERRRQAERGEL